MADSSVYSNVQLCTTYSRKIRHNQSLIDSVNAYQKRLDDLNDFIELCSAEEGDYSADINNELTKLSKDIEDFYVKVLLNEKYDDGDAILKIHSGAGGTEACDWVSMLFRMYKMYAERHNMRLDVIDYIDGDGVGYKSITFRVVGENAYGYLKGEMGVHRLVRISPFDANKRRHTSFASVEVMPIIEDDDEVVINDKDIKIDTYRSSGAGGQHVNTTDSAIRITHLPTGIVVTCQNERSQTQNKETALSMLKSKLVSLALEEKKQNIKDIKGEVKKIEWGSQIRSYVFCPYTLVKDMRTLYETSDLDGVMNGGLDDFIYSYLKCLVK